MHDTTVEEVEREYERKATRKEEKKKKKHQNRKSELEQHQRCFNTLKRVECLLFTNSVEPQQLRFGCHRAIATFARYVCSGVRFDGCTLCAAVCVHVDLVYVCAVSRTLSAASTQIRLNFF